MPDKPGLALETLDPARNFALSTEERVRAVAGGPPAYLRRRRAIEDATEGIVRLLVERCEEAVAEGADVREHARAHAPMRTLERLNDLVSRHNRYYPIEANLPIHPPTGELMDRTGEPWRPMKPWSMEELIECAVARLRTPG
jgi:hypothetical protein